MKNCGTLMICAVFALSLFSSSVHAQNIPINEPNYNKPLMFQSLRDTINVDVTGLNALTNLGVSNSVNINLGTANGLQIVGSVISTSFDPKNGSISSVIRCSNFPGFTFAISKVINPTDNSITYKGRILSFQYGDLLELQNKNGQYVFVKKNFYDVVNE